MDANRKQKFSTETQRTRRIRSADYADYTDFVFEVFSSRGVKGQHSLYSGVFLRPRWPSLRSNLRNLGDLPIDILCGEILLFSIRVYSRPFVVGLGGLARFCFDCGCRSANDQCLPLDSLCLITPLKFVAVPRLRCSLKHRMPTAGGYWLAFVLT
jgi:hypothetical protein